MTITIRPGIYLEDNPPARRKGQFRVGRRDPLKPVVVVHTAQSGTDTRGADTKAEAVAAFIQRRQDAGSYHILGDRDSIIRLVRIANEAYGDGTGSNRWAIHISLAMDAGDWGMLLVNDRAAFEQYVESAATMALLAAKACHDRGLPVPAARLMTKEGSDRAGACGFISHGRRDPARRTDPGADFPWGLFFARYAALCVAEGLPDPSTTNNGETAMEKPDEKLTRFIQKHWNRTMADKEPLSVDGDWGPKTASAATVAWLAESLQVESQILANVREKLFKANSELLAAEAQIGESGSKRHTEMGKALDNLLTVSEIREAS